ncbi:MAG: aldo/keto reductase [Planctomycetota bacterium]|nr:aldo/keto reductase [Planctomycetota bacterium]
MKLRPLGSSGLLVSPICLGTMTFGSPVPERDAIGLIHAALDKGINFVDTANVYEGYKRFLGSPGGVAEEIVGKADRGLSPVHILREVDRSLKRLQTDTIDLYIIHWPDREVPLETTLSAIDVALKQGKIRSFGVSNHAAWQIAELRALAERHGWPSPVSSQIPFSLLRREFQYDLEYCQKRNVGVTPYQSLQGGLLTGKYRRGTAAPTDSRLAEKPEWMWPMNEGLFDKLEAVEKLAAEVETTPARYALAWTLTQPAMSSLIVGVKSVAQIDDALAAVQVAIPPEHVARINAVCPPPWRQNDPLRG